VLWQKIEQYLFGLADSRTSSYIRKNSFFLAVKSPFIGLLGQGRVVFVQRFLKTEAGKAVYNMRKQIVEPVFGYSKEGRGFRRFRFRGLGNVRSEWRLICATHNLLKLFRSSWKMQPLRS
jgi:hypothetical protein